MPKTRPSKPTARQDRQTNARQKGENHKRDERLSDHDSELTAHDEKLDTQKGRLDTHDTDIVDIRKGSGLNQNSVGSRELASHEPPANIDPESQQYREGGGATRAAGRYHIKPWGLRDEHVPPEEFSWSKMRGKAPNSKIAQDFADFARANNVYSRATTDRDFLKSENHDDFEGGHGNAHHRPDFAVAAKSGSIPFKSLPAAERQVVLDRRAFLRDGWAGATTDQRQQGLKNALLDMYHMVVDSPEDVAEELHARMEVDPEFQDVLFERQGEDLDPGSYYIAYPGPDNGGGTPAMRARKAVSVEALDATQITLPNLGGISGDTLIVVTASDEAQEMTAPVGWNKFGTSVNGGARLTYFARAWGALPENERTFTTTAPGDIAAVGVSFYATGLPMTSAAGGNLSPRTALVAPQIEVTQARSTIFHAYAVSASVELKPTLYGQSVVARVSGSKSILLGLLPNPRAGGLSPAGAASSSEARPYASMTFGYRASV